jgi:hypothetical protein
MKSLSDKRRSKDKPLEETKVSNKKLMTLANAKACARSIRDKTSKDILKTFEENEIKLSPGADVLHQGMKKVNLVGAVSRLPESISSSYNEELKEKRQKAWKRSLKLSLHSSKEKCKRHKNKWCKIPEFLITRYDDAEHRRSSNVEKRQFLELPKFYIGERVGPLYAIQSWENRKPADEDYGSFSRSFGPIENPGVEPLPYEWAPSKQDLESYFDNYTKAAAFCNGDPMGALVRASFRERNSIFSIDIESIRPEKYCPIHYGNPSFDFGIEYNGIYFSVSGKDATEALLITTTDIEWRGLLYRRALYHDVNERIPIDFDLSVIRTLCERKPKVDIIEECKDVDIPTMNILQTLAESVKTLFPSREITNNPVIREELEDSSSDSESSEDEESDDELDVDRQNLVNFYKIYREADNSEERTELMYKCLEIDECLQAKFSDYDSYSEELTRQIEMEEPEYSIYPKVAMYYYFMINIFKDHSKRSLINLLTYLCDKFRIPKSKVKNFNKVVDVEPEFDFIESENLSIFQIESLTIIKNLSEETYSDFDESSYTDERVIELMNLTETLEILEESVKRFEVSEEGDLDKVLISSVDIENISSFKDHLEDKSRFMSRLTWVVESVRGIG